MRSAPLWIVLALACASSNGAEPVWSKAGASDADRQAATRECVAEAEANLDERGDAQRRERVQADVGGVAFIRCMEARGWKQTLPDG